jgi:two-component system KDP operon response regulator KdpE
VTRAVFRVLVMENDPTVRGALSALLKQQGYRLVEAATAARAVIEARSYRPDLLLVDLDLPDADGIVVIRRVRTWSTVPILALSSANGEQQKVAALDAGADDYIAKPFSSAELLARVRAGLRRRSQGEQRPPGLKLGRLRVDLARRHVGGPRGEIHLTSLEYRVLDCLAQQVGRVVGRRELLGQAWGPNRKEDTNSLRVCISNLRAKIEPNPRKPRYLITVNGLGYRLCTDHVPCGVGARRPTRLQGHGRLA